jgi:osmoprotectant transport system permease protein
VGIRPALVALALLAIPPLVINVDLGIRGVAPSAIDAATGLGMTAAQRFTRVIVPLSLPVAIAGVRTAAVEVIASATLATFIGAGGLGDDIVRALQTNDASLLLAAAALVAALAFVAEFALGKLGAMLERAA